MIKLLRVDHRLIHGQVAFSWTNALSINAILVANDSVMTDRFRKTSIKLAKPAGVKLVVKDVKEAINIINSGKTDKYNLMVIVENLEDAKELAINCPSVLSINLGGSKHSEGSEKIGKAFFITENDKKIIKELIDNNVELEVRQLPNDNKILIEDI